MRQYLKDIILKRRALLTAVLLAVFVLLTGAHAAYAEEEKEKAPEKKPSKYLVEEEERWKGGPAFFESVEGIERIPVPSVADWKTPKAVPLPQGAVEFPEFKSDPQNPNRDMIAKEAWDFPPYPKFSYFGLSNREIVWIIAQLHILFAAFILGVSLFVITSEIMGRRTGEKRYERLAKETMKIVVICYSFTALTGGFLLLLLVTFYPSLMFWLFRGFKNTITFWYPMCFIVETILMYCYYYMWEPLERLNKKGIHIIIGILLNLVGTAVLVLMNAPASFMLTPTKLEGSLKPIAMLSEWQWINNGIWASFNAHRMIANLTYGGFVVALIGAFMYLISKTEEERKYYDWQGYLGNTIGIGFLFPLIGVGYYHAYEVYKSDPAIGMYIMSDRLSMFMLVQAILISFLFIGSNYYMWLSMQRIEGAAKYLKCMKYTYIAMFICFAIWFTPRHYFATMVLEPGMVPEGMTPEEYLKGVELPGRLAFLALMRAKNTAAVVLILLTILNYVLYRIAVKKGKIRYGEINLVSQYVLMILAFSATWLMGLMGAIRELARKNYHVFMVMKDMTEDAYTPTLQHVGVIITFVTLIFYIFLFSIIWMQLKFAKSPHEE